MATDLQRISQGLETLKEQLENIQAGWDRAPPSDRDPLKQARLCHDKAVEAGELIEKAAHAGALDEAALDIISSIHRPDHHDGDRARLDRVFLRISEQWLSPRNLSPLWHHVHVVRGQKHRVAEGYARAVGMLADEIRDKKPDGPEEPNKFWWLGVEHELKMEPKMWQLFKFIWNKPNTKISDIGKAVWKNRHMKYDKMKATLYKVNLAMEKAAVPISFSKARTTGSIERTVHQNGIE